MRARLRRTPRWLRSVLLAVVGVYIVYLIAANVVLRTHLLRGWLSTNESVLRLDYSSARSFFPGHVVVHDLRLRFQDKAVQMSVALDRASLDIDLWKLTQHTARFENVRAEGVEYRLRVKVDADTAGDDPRLKAFPSIDGYEDPAVIKDGPPRPPTATDWIIEIRDITASVRDVWTNEYRLRGDSELSGGFHIHPHEVAYVTPSVMHTRSGILSLGDREFIRGGEWTLQVQIDPFAPHGPSGVEVLRYITFTVHQEGGVLSIAPIGATYLPKNSGLALDDGAGPLAIDVHVDHGIVQPESRVTYHSDEVRVRASPFTFKGDAEIVAHVVMADGKPRMVAEASTSRLALAPAAELEGVRAEIELGGVDTTAPIVIARLAGALTSGHIANLRSWQPIAKNALTFDGGAISTSAHAEYRDGALTGRVDSTLEKVGLTVGPFSFVGSGKTSTDVASKDVSTSIGFPHARVSMHELAVKLMMGHAEGLWLDARSDDTKVATSGATATDSNIQVESGPGDETVKLFTRMTLVPDVAADITAGKRLEASVHLRVRHEDIAMNVMGARNGVLQGRGRLHKPGDHPQSGAFIFSVGPVTAGLDIDHGKVSVHPLASGTWLDETLARR